MAAFLNIKYKLEKSENFDEYMKELGEFCGVDFVRTVDFVRNDKTVSITSWTIGHGKVSNVLLFLTVYTVQANAARRQHWIQSQLYVETIGQPWPFNCVHILYIQVHVPIYYIRFTLGSKEIVAGKTLITTIKDERYRGNFSTVILHAFMKIICSLGK